MNFVRKPLNCKTTPKNPEIKHVILLFGFEFSVTLFNFFFYNITYLFCYNVPGLIIVSSSFDTLALIALYLISFDHPYTNLGSFFRIRLAYVIFCCLNSFLNFQIIVARITLHAFFPMTWVTALLICWRASQSQRTMKRRRPHRLCRWMLLMIAAGFLPPHPSTAQGF